MAREKPDPHRTNDENPEWTDEQLADAQPARDAELHQLLRATLRAAGLRDADTVYRLAGGSRSLAFCIDENYVLRLNNDKWSKEAFDNERRALEFLSDLDLPIPKLLGFGNYRGWNWQVTGRLLGEPVAAVWSSSTSRQRERLIECTAEALTILHRVRVPGFGCFCGLSFGSPQLEIESSVESHTSAALANGRLRAQEAELVGAAIAKQLTLLPGPLTSVFVHNDWHFWNLLTDGKRITGILDFEWSRGSDAFADLAIDDFLEEMCPGSSMQLLDRYLRNSDDTHGWEERRALHVMMWRLEQTATRRNTDKARLNRSELLALCTEALGR
jgi:hygromycin-B 4-O-kinase